MRSIMLLSLLITAMMGYRPEGKNYRAMQAAAQRINQLASPDSILSEADSRSYVDALSSQWGVDGPSFEAFKERVARAEFLAVRDPNARVSEDSVASGFNLLMKELGSPRGMRLTKDQVHNFRRNFFAMAAGLSMYNNMFARRVEDGNLDDHCRPVEALYLMFLLQFGPNMEASNAGANLPRREKTRVSVRATFAAPSTRESEYSAAVDRYFRKHSESEFAEALDRMLDNLLGVLA
jgi:hypothetical protein